MNRDGLPEDVPQVPGLMSEDIPRVVPELRPLPPPPVTPAQAQQHRRELHRARDDWGGRRKRVNP